MRHLGKRWRALAVGALVVGPAAVHPAEVRTATDTVTNCSSDDGMVTYQSQR